MGTVLSGLQRVRPVVRFGNALSGPGCGGRMQSALPPLRTITRALPCSSAGAEDADADADAGADAVTLDHLQRRPGDR